MELDAEDFAPREAARERLRGLGEAGAEVLRGMDQAKWSLEQKSAVGALLEVARLPRAKIELLRKDMGFLLDCLESEEPVVRALALARLRKETGQALDFDVQAPVEKRAAALDVLREKVVAAPTQAEGK